MANVRRLAATVIAAGAIGLLPASSSAGGGGCYTGPTQGEGHTVEMEKACFTPSTLHVRPGTTVTFENRDPFPHNVVGLEWASPRDLRDGMQFRTTFQEEGIYPYACSYHYGMAGAIVVGDGRGAGSGAPVEVGPLGEAAPQSNLVQAGGISEGESPKGDQVGFAVAGGLGLLVGAGVVGAIRRSKRS